MLGKVGAPGGPPALGAALGAGAPVSWSCSSRVSRPSPGAVTGGAADVRLGDEFHHNGLSLRCAQIGRTPRGTAGEWDRHRLSAETIRLLRHSGELVREHLVTDVVPLEEAPRLLNELAERRRHVVSAVFTTGVA